MVKGNIMTPKHKLWREFINRLSGPEGCNVREDEYGKTIWNCAASTDRVLATAILKTMPNIDVDKSLKYFEKHGGYCDCEILMNIDRSTYLATKIFGANISSPDIHAHHW